MSEPDAHLKNMVRAFLESKGIPTEEIPPSHVEGKLSPDLLLSPNTPDATVMELKTKVDDIKWMAALNDDLDLGAIVSRVQATNRWNQIKNIISYGVDQMNDFDPKRKLFRTLWFHCTGFNAELAKMRLQATIYGMEKLMSMELQNIAKCHYFWDSSFYYLKNDLDGVVISIGHTAQLNVNDHSPRYTQFLSSNLARAFDGAIYHAGMYPDDKEFMTLYSATPRRDPEPLLEELRKKYSLSHLQIVGLGMHSTIIRPTKSEPTET